MTEPAKSARLADIITLASLIFGVSEDDIKSRSRERRLAKVRAAIVRVARLQDRPASFPQIAAALGGRDHTSILHAIDMAEVYAKDEAFARGLATLEERAGVAEPFVRERMAARRLAGQPQQKSESAVPDFFAPRLKQKPRNDFTGGQGVAEQAKMMRKGSAKLAAEIRAALAERQAA